MVFHTAHSPRLLRFKSFFFIASLVVLCSLSVVLPSVAKKHHKQYGHKTHHTVHYTRGHKRQIRKPLSKKPVSIPGHMEQHMPPPGHDGEEHSDWFWQRRAWPNRTIDPNAYPTALAEARRMPELHVGSGKNGALSTFEWQSIGPNSIDGRVTCVATDPIDSNTFYIGAAAGGLWKTTDHGNSWHCLTDTFGSLAMGCVTVDPQNPKTIYIGLGECNQSGDSYPGNGLWKSTNGGSTWNYIGFAHAQYINKVLIDPRDDQHVYVAIPGVSTPTSDTNRGIFYSTDGGATWTHSLMPRLSKAKSSPPVGCIDIAMNPLNSGELLAYAWDHSFQVFPGNPGPTGSGSGVWRSTDSGATWNRLDTVASSGLENGYKLRILGRGALLWTASEGKSYAFVAIIRRDTNPVTHYPFDENFEGLYRSTDEGVTWAKVLDSTKRIPMGGVQGKDSANLTNAQGGYDFYLASNPLRPNEVYLGGIDVFRSTDFGLSFTDITNSYSQYYVKGNREQHSDQHGLAFTASVSGTDMIVVSDGGVFHTNDFGTSWNQLTGLPITEFYTIEPWSGGMINTPATISATDLKLFGGTQDNGTVGHGLTTGSQSFGTDSDFAWINHGDGGVSISVPGDSNKLISSLQLGVIFARNTLDSLVPLPLDMRDTAHDARPRWHTITYRLLFGPHALTDTMESCGFVAPIALDEQNPTELYTGREHVYHAVLDWNDLENTRWYKWSPVLAGVIANDSQWYYGNIETIAIGPKDPNLHPMLWAGGWNASANSGAVWRTVVDLTRSDTTAPSWISVNHGLPIADVGVIVPDRSDSLTAFLTNLSASNIGHVFKTTDGGATWTNASGNLPATPVNALVIDTLAEHGDPALKNQILIVGTDVGVFATTNGGTMWYALNDGMPNALVSDLKIYKNMLIAATHGRSLYAMDISALKPGAFSVSESAVHIPLTITPNPVSGDAVICAGVSGSASSCRLIGLSTGRTYPAELTADGFSGYRITFGPEVASGTYIVQLLDGMRVLGEGRISVVR